ncbi:MAG: hypothetical protein AAFQ51_19735 [Pseudomonadota bacterium]
MSEDPSNLRNLIKPIIGMTVFSGMILAVTGLLITQWADMPWAGRIGFIVCLSGAVWVISKGIRRIFARARGEKGTVARRTANYLDRDGS